MLHARGSLLTIDVENRTATTSDIGDVLENAIGGRGAGTYLAHERIPFDVDPLGPDNRLYFATGPLQQSQMSFTGRMSLTGVSPLTNGLLSSNAGGYLSRHFVDTGHSVVEITGTSDELLAIHVSDEGVEFEEVPDLAQATVPEVSEAMHTRHGHDPEQLTTIGPAGENGVRFASVMTYDNRAFGRGGLGAALGAKNVKTISYSGDSAPEVDLPATDLHQEIHRTAATSDDIMRRQGTTNLGDLLNYQFSLPTRYFSEMSFDEGIDNINGDAVEEAKYEKAACSVCAFACKLPTRDEETGFETEGPEFETIFSFGSSCGIDELLSIMKSNELCDSLGMDTISCGVTIAGYLESNDEFGNSELVHDLIEKIAYREDEGDLLAEGIDRIHDELGIENWSVKGLEHAAHDGRAAQGQGLSYAVANRGADHLYSGTMILEYHGIIDPEGTAGKAPVVIQNENETAVKDSGVICVFGGQFMDEETIATLFNTDYETLQSAGARIVELERHFNNRRGMDAEQDWIPYDLPDLEDSIQEYYELRGWNADGTVPETMVAEYAG